MNMTVKAYEKYDPQFPEQFNWGMIESIKLTAVAEQIVREIKNEFVEKPQDERLKVAGLRHALNIIASVAEI
jgi:hypothetical protein